MTDAGPIAFNTLRMNWKDVPATVQGRISELAGAEVAVAHSTPTGFSPGFAGILDLANGKRVFVKATGEKEHPWSISLGRHEIVGNAALPASAPSPRLLWSEDTDWVLAGFEVIDGRTPELPWTQAELTTVLAVFTDFAHTKPADGHKLEPFADNAADLLTIWATFADLPDAERTAQAERGGPWGEWALRHLSSLVEWERRAAAVTKGDSLVHSDLRADNMMIDTDQKVWFLDWAHTTLGAPWLDLAFFLPSVEMQGGGPAHAHFRAHPLSDGVSHEELRAVVTILAGFFLVHSWHDAPEQIPTLRAFQAGQAVPCVRWLQALEPGLD